MPVDPSWPPLGALIERVDRPLLDLFAFTLGGGRGVVLLAAGPARPSAAVALAPARPRGEPADAAVRGLRERLEGARILTTFTCHGAIGFDAQRPGSDPGPRWRVVADAAGLRCQPATDDAPPTEPWTLSSLDLVADQTHWLARAARTAAAAVLRRARGRLQRRADAIEGDLAAADEATRRAEFASIFVPAAASARPGQTGLRATDWSTGEPREATFPLAPDRPARAQLDALFARARRLREGRTSALTRRDDALLGTMQIDEALAALPTLADPAAVRALLGRLAAALPGDIRLAAKQGPPTRHDTPAARPYRRYESASGTSILVGRDAAANDQLTMRLARPADLWLHARGRPGSHVIVPGWNAGDAVALIDAATLAAHFSDARGDDAVEVQYGLRRHVRKRRGAAPGAVELTDEKVLLVRIEADRLARLLATCDRDLVPV